ncbi:ankyrin repeat-containing domain protein [Pisolithus croceorrhizus]|nr:ankyrin repeat-containing domain protein [Pisolithus croceorrhizus]
MDPLTILSALATLQASADGAHRILLTLGSFATSIMKAEQSRRKVLEEAQSFRVVLAAVQTQLSAVTRRQDMGAINHHLPALLPLRSSLENCDKISYDLVYQLESSHKSWHSRLLWPEKEKELQRCLTTLQRFKGDMSLLLQAMTLDRVLSVHDLVTQGEDTARDSRQSKVLEWLQCIDCSEEHASVRRRRKQSTCTWLFRDECFTRWYESRGGGLLWMYGKPGVGKTVITSAVIDELQERNCTLAYFYCDYQKARDVQVTDILRSLVAQFFRQSDKNWLSSFPDVLKLQSRGFPLPSDHAILLEWLLKSARLHEQPVIVLDALDECEDVCGRELLKIISRMNTGHLSLFLASRDEPRIRKAYEEILTGAFFFSTTVSLEERWQTRRDDLHTLVVQELGSRRSLGCLPDEVRTDMLERLLEKSGGMFRWVQCQLDRLEKCIGTREIKQVLDTLPEGLNETYCRILSVINERPFCKRVVLRVLSWLIVSLRPLHIQAVMEAVKIEIGEFTIDDEMGVIDEDCLLEACSSLVSLDEKTRMLSLSHFSVKEYLTDEQTFHSELQEFHISPATAHRQLALSSITYTLVSDVYHRLPSLPECQRLLSYCITNGLQHVRYTSSDDGQLLYYLDVFQQHVIENPQKLDKLKMLARTLSNDFFNTLLDAPNCVSSIVLQFGSPWLVNRYLDLRPNVINGTGVGNPLKYAIQGGRLDVVQELLVRGQDPKQPSASYWGGSVTFEDFDPISFALSEKRQLTLPFVENLCSLMQIIRGDIIHHICCHDHWSLSLIQILLERGADAAYLDEQGQSALHKCIRACDREDTCLEIALLLVEAGCYVDSQDWEGQSPLHIAVYSGFAAVTRFLLDRGADISYIDKQGDSVLHKCLRSYAFGEVRKELLLLLLEEGASVDIENSEGETPLHLAGSRGFDLAIRVLLDFQATIAHLDKNGRSVLEKYFLTPNGWHEDRFETVWLLVEAGFPIDLRNSAGETLLHLVARSGTASQIRTLMELGADSFALDNWGACALHKCFDRDDQLEVLNIVEVLAEGGCPIDAPDPHNETPLHLAARRRFFSVVEFLLGKGADCTSLDEDGASALHKCLYSQGFGETVEIVQLLLEAGCSVDVRNSKGEVPMHLAAGQGFPSVIRLLLAWVADVTSVDMAGNSALHWCLTATYRRNEEACLQTARLLVDAGCPPDLPNSLGETPLHLAASSGFDSMARVLVDAGCDVNARNSEGKTPLHYAVLRDVRAVRFLLSAGACLPNDIITTVLSHPKKLVGQQSCFTSLLIHFDNPLFDMLSTLVQHARTLGQSGVFACDEGQTPLHRLLRLGKREYLTSRQTQDVVRMLVECGCDHLLPDGVGLTPIELASERGHEKIVNYLLNHGAKLPGTTHVRA